MSSVGSEREEMQEMQELLVNRHDSSDPRFQMTREKSLRNVDDHGRFPAASAWSDSESPGCSGKKIEGPGTVTRTSAAAGI